MVISSESEEVFKNFRHLSLLTEDSG